MCRGHHSVMILWLFFFFVVLVKFSSPTGNFTSKEGARQDKSNVTTIPGIHRGKFSSPLREVEGDNNDHTFGEISKVQPIDTEVVHSAPKSSNEKSHPEEVTTLPRSSEGKSSATTGERTGLGFAVTLPVATALIIAVALTGLWVYRRKQVQPSREEAILMVPLGKGGKGFTAVEEDETEKIRMPTPRPVELQYLESVVREEKCKSSPFKEEYQDIPRNQQASWSHATHESVQQKNRFKNILPYNHSRVILSKDDNPGSDYINASFILGYNGKKDFIAAQGPSRSSLNDFWRMIWEQNSALIVMLTNLFEDGKVKCSQYWPDEEPVQYGHLKVSLILVKELPDFTIRTLKVEEGNRSREVLQYHFTSWPDHGVPQHATGLLNFRRKARQEITKKKEDGPVIVHCSAGCGRTGAFLAIDYLIQQAEHEKQIDVKTCMGLMRKNRVNMVQTEEQYSFVYTAMLEAVWVGETLIPCEEFAQVYEHILCPDLYSSSTKIEEQYKLLESMKPSEKEGDFSTALNPANILKNRSLGIIPANNKNPLLMTRVDDRTSYINAVFVDGRNHFGKFIATQMPLADTVVDLWRMVHDYKCTCIIMLNTQTSGEQVTGGYWPRAEKPQIYGPLTVTKDKEEHGDICIIRDFTVTYKSTRKTESVRVRQFCLRGMIADGNPMGDLFYLQNEVDKWQRSLTKSGPIIVHCLDGAQETGMYLAMSDLIDMMTMEQEVDVFQTVQTIRKDRPQFITSLMQYQHLYEGVKQFVDMSSKLPH